MTPRRAVLLLALLTAGCPPASVGPALTEAELAALAKDREAQRQRDALATKAKALATEAAQVQRALDEALWTHWTTGAPLDVARTLAGHDALFTPATLEALREARAAEALSPRRLRQLELFVAGETLARQTAEESTTVANLEASLTVPVDGKEVRYAEVERLLSQEPSALKRRALWAACGDAVQRLDAAQAAKDRKVREVLAALGEGSPLAFAAGARDLDPERLAQVADRFLERTELAWREVLTRRASSALGLPMDKVTRADVPRLVRSPVDALFPRAEVAPRALKTLGGLGLYGVSGLTVDVKESARKVPLPLTVAPGGPADVRLSARPQGGLLDEAALLAELGAALSLRFVTAGLTDADWRGAGTSLGSTGKPLADADAAVLSRLGDPGAPQVSAELFASLAGDAAWLQEMGLKDAGAAKAAEAWQAARLYALRRAAGRVLLWAQAPSLTEDEVRARFVALQTRVLGFPLAEPDGQRWRLERADAARSASRFRAALLAAALREQLVAKHGAAWWRSPDAATTLKALWAPGTTQDVEGRVAPLEHAMLALARQLGAAVPAEGEGPVPFKRPAAPALDGGAQAAAPAALAPAAGTSRADGGVTGADAGTPDAGTGTPGA